MIEAAKNEARSNVENDAKQKAAKRLNAICHRRGGKFKISEKQFSEELENMWISGEFSCAERILRCIEIDKELNSRDLIRGEIHLFILDLYKILKERLDLKEDLQLEDLLDDGKYFTGRIMESREHNEIKKETPEVIM